MSLNLLDYKRYAIIPLKKVDAYVALIDLELSAGLPAEAKFLNSTMLTGGHRGVFRLFFSRQATAGEFDIKPSEEQIEDAALELALMAQRPQASLIKSDYEVLLKGCVLGAVELFNRRWCISLGSSRGVSLSRYTLKGVGITLPTWSLDHRDASGVLERPYGIFSFMVSHIMDSVLPLGAVRAAGVLFLKKQNTAILIREACAPRLSQVFFDQNLMEKKKLRLYLENTFSTNCPKAMLKRVIEQLATCYFLGGGGVGAPDNILIDGKIIDEEDWVIPSASSNVVCWRVNFKSQKASNPIELLEEGEYLDSSFSLLSSCLKAFIETYQEIFEIELSYRDAYDCFVNELDSLGGSLGEKWKIAQNLKAKMGPEQFKIVNSQIQDSGGRLEVVEITGDVQHLCVLFPLGEGALTENDSIYDGRELRDYSSRIERILSSPDLYSENTRKQINRQALGYILQKQGELRSRINGNKGVEKT